MARTVVLPDLSDEDATFIISVAENEHVPTKKEKQSNGKWTVTITYPDQDAETVAKSEAKLATIAKAAVASKSDDGAVSEDPLWLQIARSELGQAEVPGPASNPRIVEYASTVAGNIKTDDVPWCSSFVNFCITHAGLAGTNSAAARSWLQWGKAATTPKPGAVAVFSRGAPPAGHVGFYTGETDNFVLVLGGNQGDKVSIVRYPKDRLLGYRVPK